LRGKGFTRWLAAPVRLWRAVTQARRALAKRKPGVVLGCGGFASGPGGIAAWLSGAPLVIHEQNAVAGLTNRWLARVASRIAEGFPGSFPASRKALYVGKPGAARDRGAPAAAAALRIRNGPMRLFVFGGSQGATALNRLVPAAGCTPAGRTPPLGPAPDRRDRSRCDRGSRIAPPASRPTCARSSTTWLLRMPMPTS
jgi:UDP-N-acetylglucosamine--N-acetylmuramyl-(pentapeptide) pyrophosphoryl-undecaprenol N-acetylglucosamine transferase